MDVREALKQITCDTLAQIGRGVEGVRQIPFFELETKSADFFCTPIDCCIPFIHIERRCQC